MEAINLCTHQYPYHVTSDTTHSKHHPLWFRITNQVVLNMLPNFEDSTNLIMASAYHQPLRAADHQIPMARCSPGLTAMENAPCYLVRSQVVPTTRTRDILETDILPQGVCTQCICTFNVYLCDVILAC
jgi:hypothetical protein